MRIAVVRNQARGGVINQFGPPSPEKYGKRTVVRVVRALEAHGHEVALLEGDKTLLATLEAFAPPDPDTGEPTGLVLNLAYGIQGESRYTHVPAMLELAGVPYTGASPLGHDISLDKAIAKRLLQAVALPTPAFALMHQPGPTPNGLDYPLIVKPRRESTSYGLALARDHAELEQAVATIVERYGQAALVEQFIDGREVCVALLGNSPPVVLPVVELSFDDRRPRLMTWADKYHRRSDEPTKLCPAPLPPALLRRVEVGALRTFECCLARDYARVDMRIDRWGEPWVLELNSMASLGPGGSYVRAAEVAGLSFDSLVNRIVEVARARYRGMPAATRGPARARELSGGRELSTSRVASLPAQRTA
jgi:D-alanine-D-alanine ligase